MQISRHGKRKTRKEAERERERAYEAGKKTAIRKLDVK
jgi:hypothetical protein